MPTLTGTPYQELLTAIADYYGSGSDQWVQVAKYGTTADDFIDIVNQLPNYQVVSNKAGDIISYQKIDSIAVSNSASVIDSNVVTSPVKVSTPATVATDAQTGKVVATKGISTATGTQFITKSVIPAIAAAGVGITLGKTIDSVLYNANPDFWDANGMSALNPETWSMITADMSDSTGEVALATAFNILYGIDPATNKSQAYIDQNALAYLALYMQDNNVFMSGETIESADVSYIDPVYRYKTCGYRHPQTGNTYFMDVLSIQDGYVTLFEEPNGYLTRMFASSTPNAVGTVTSYYYRDGELIDTSTSDVVLSSRLYYNGEYMYIAQGSYGGTDWVADANLSAKQESNEIMSYLLVNGTYSSQNIDGIGNQPGAVLPNISTETTVAGVLSALQSQYPDLFNNAVSYPVMQPDGTEKTFTYVPIALPDATSATDTQPTASGQDISQATPAYDPSNMPENVWDYIWQVLQPTPTEIDTPTDTTGDGESPAIVPPTGSASALWRIYNPSQAQLDTFGAWLWSSNFVDQLLKVFSDPMQAIIGLHKVFVSPPVSGSGPIKVGYLVSDASANYVSGQYVDVDCGSVTLDEYFNNVFDYESTEVSIYLPFSGIHKLNTSDVMRGEINVIYHVDVLTGACLIDISVIRDDAGGVLYTFSGNCAVQYPVSSGSYVGIVTGLLGIAGGIAGTIASGGMLAPMLMGAGASIGGMHTNVSHSGNISSNAGAMGAKIPYLIIERPQTKTPPTAVTIEGLPQNEIVTLSTLTGFTRVKKARYDGISCTSDELTIIRGLLESGVYIN